jgi:hypothetical protein
MQLVLESLSKINKVSINHVRIKVGNLTLTVNCQQFVNMHQGITDAAANSQSDLDLFKATFIPVSW